MKHLLEKFILTLSVSSWGGEDDEIPEYGIVKIAINPISKVQL